MFATPAVALIGLGLLTLVGLGLTALSLSLLAEGAVPACCRQRVDAFLVRIPHIVLAAAASAVSGLALLLS